MKILTRRATLAGTAALALAGCSSKFRSYSGPEVTRLLVYKDRREMYLLSGRNILESYKFGLGFAPKGHKQFEGDGKTPEGSYIIDRRNPNSSYHLSLGISYPNEADIAYARSQGKSPGGDIFIHGARESRRDRRGSDWTAGCIWVKNREIEKIYAMVKNGTPIDIYA